MKMAGAGEPPCPGVLPKNNGVCGVKPASQNPYPNYIQHLGFMTWIPLKNQFRLESKTIPWPNRYTSNN